jgi:ribonuclease-3
MTEKDQARLQALEALASRIGHDFADLSQLDRALRHASTGNRTDRNYERLEFLGDAILGFLVAEKLFSMEPEIKEGRLTETRANLVSRGPLSEVASSLDLVSCLDMGKSLQEGALNSQRILSDLVEAVLGAVYLDGGLDAARRFVETHILTMLPEALGRTGRARDSKSKLLHFAQKYQLGQPTYRVVETTGRQHEQEFRVAVHVGTRNLAEGMGRSKQAAEKQAAAIALELLQKDRTHGELSEGEEPETT